MPNKQYRRVATRTGEILSVVSIPDTDAARDLYNTHLEEGSGDSRTEYSVNGILTPRPPMPYVLDTDTITADGADTARMTCLPIPASIRVSGPHGLQVMTIDDGEFEFQADMPGDYQLEIEAFPYRQAEVVIHAV
ncbi:hypothetical protein [Methylococcus mesophilus]|uniref:hypothetical protein n=1 Tax=Methylococcus mesophilus TaxID=2993564 RepID=UPI00224B4839|nr:hypothetical protein [Methylococcus mesophilus]UZR27488.1 hypothetical protein OOT43_12160 [Methylococcus mesophilus]